MDYIDNLSLKKYLQGTNLLTLEALEESYAYANQNNDSLGKVLIEKNLLKLDDLYKMYSYILGVPFVNLKEFEVDRETLNSLPLKYVKKYKILVYNRVFNSLEVAMVNPVDYEAMSFIRKKTGFYISPRLTTEKSFEETLDKYKKYFNEEQLQELDNINKDVEKFKRNYSDLLKISQGEGVVNLLDSIIRNALEEKVSSIHIEPDNKEIVVKYRNFGKLKTILTLPIRISPSLIGRIKILSNLDLQEENCVQEGRFKKNKANFIVSIFPVFEGERVTIKIINNQEKGLNITDLKIKKDFEKKIDNFIKRYESGLILFSGKKLKGKTTSMYTFLKDLDTSIVNTSTIEDRVSYSLKGINQIELDSTKEDLKETLSKIINQDPDVIMIDSKKNEDALKEIFQAALTSHTVLASLETKNVQETLKWLVEKKIDKFYLSGALKFIISQTFVNKLCDECKIKRKLTASDISYLETILDLKKINKLLFEEGVLKTKDKTIKDIFYYKSKGCKFCNKSGYKGKLLIQEIIEFDEKQEKNIEREEDDDDNFNFMENIIKTAKNNGTISFLEDAFIKASKGLTSIDEVFFLANND